MAVNRVNAGGSSTDVAAIIAHELAALAADARTLQSRVVTGDVLSALVLPSNGLTDLLQIGGLRVAAELPPTLVPGETIAVAVTGFSGDRISLHILPDSGAQRALEPRPPATVGQSPAAVVLSVPETATDTALGDVAVPAPAVAGQVVRPQPAPLGAIEARLATARAAVAATVPPPIVPNAHGAARAGTASPPPFAASLVRSSIAVRPASVERAALQPSLRLPVAQIATELPGASPPKMSPSSSEPSNIAVSANSPSAKPAAIAYTDATRILRSLFLPVTPSNLAAARIALDAPQTLPRVLAQLERALPAANDPHVTTLRTLTAFLSRIEPASPVLATQVASYVDHIVVGRESKLVQLLVAHERAAAPHLEPPVDRESGPLQSAVAARVPWRAAALDYDLKSNVLAVASQAASGAGDEAPLTTALHAALGAVTAVQAGAAALLAADPNAFAFNVPLALPNGYAQAHVRIGRDAPQAGNAPLDGDNFHIAFVLDTQHLGTIAVDLMTVGRSVTVGVQTQASPARQTFGAALHRLTDRLETLRYRVIKADAAVAPRGRVAPPVAVSPPAIVPSSKPRPGVDVDA